MTRRNSLLGRVVLLIGLSFFTVELVLLAVFTLLYYQGLRDLERDRLDRQATLVREQVRAALLGLVPQESDLDRRLDQAVETGQAGRAPPAGLVPALEDEDTEVWVFTPTGEARRWVNGHLLSAQESAWQGEVPASVAAVRAAPEALAVPVEERPELISRTEPIASGRDGPPAGVLYLTRSLRGQLRQVATFAAGAFGAGAAAVLVTAIVAMLYLRRALLVPLSRLMRADVFARRGQEDKALVDAGDIPEDEIGAIMTSRNELYLAMREAQRDLDQKNAELAGQREELRSWGRELERLVQERTKALLRARDRLHRDEKLVALGRLAANVAHEINNPLASIAGWAEAGREELHGLPGPAAEEVRAALGTIEEQAFRCKEILKRLLGLARAGDLPRVEVDLTALAHDTLRQVEPGATKRGVEVLAALPDPGPRLVTEPGMLHQVVVNLLENALDAAAAGTARPAWIQLTVEDRPEGTAIVVADSGQGIAADVLPRVFDPFYTTKPVGRGTGLGLAISQSLLERLGGTISVQNGEQGGAVFTVRLPRSDESGRHHRPELPESAVALRPAPPRPPAAESRAFERGRVEEVAPAPPAAATAPPATPRSPSNPPPPPPRPAGPSDASGWLEAHLRGAGGRSGSDPDE